MLELKQISVSYKSKQVIKDLSFHAEKGEIIGLVGPNGTGKTTLFNVMANFLKPNQGKVIIDENLMYSTEKNQINIHRKLATFPDQSDLFEELNGLDHLKLYAQMWKGTSTHITTIVERLKMNHYIKKKVKTYSLGMRQRLCFAMMAAADTEIMILDEVMNGLDIANVDLISNYLIEFKQQNKLIFVASHLLRNLDLYADRVLYLRDGHFIFEQDMHANDSSYIKVNLSQPSYQKIIENHELPTGTLYLNKQVLCIPADLLKLEDQMKWIQLIKTLSQAEITIGPIGTIENYQRYYDDV